MVDHHMVQSHLYMKPAQVRCSGYINSAPSIGFVGNEDKAQNAKATHYDGSMPLRWPVVQC